MSSMQSSTNPPISPLASLLSTEPPPPSLRCSSLPWCSAPRLKMIAGRPNLTQGRETREGWMKHMRAGAKGCSDGAVYCCPPPPRGCAPRVFPQIIAQHGLTASTAPAPVRPPRVPPRGVQQTAPQSTPEATIPLTATPPRIGGPGLAKTTRSPTRPPRPPAPPAPSTTRDRPGKEVTALRSGTK